jgi:selenocysteine lyase/cysteine desulfurase
MADGHKWLLGPEGIAVFYVSAKALDALQLTQYGWHMVEAMHDFDNREWQIAKSARRFECGSPNMLGIHALHASLSLLLEAGMENVAQRVRENAEYLHHKIQAHKALQLLSDTRPQRYAGIVTFAMPGCDVPALYNFLMKQGVICAPRGGGIRFSPHFYTSKTHIDHAINLLEHYHEM